MKRLIDIGSHFIGFRDEAETLKGKTSTHFVAYILSYFFFAFRPSLTFLLQERYVALKSALTPWRPNSRSVRRPSLKLLRRPSSKPMIWKPSLKLVKQLARRLKKMLSVSKTCAKDFKLLKTP
jgi:hypothetical protein